MPTKDLYTYKLISQVKYTDVTITVVHIHVLRINPLGGRWEIFKDHIFLYMLIHTDIL